MNVVMIRKFNVIYARRPYVMIVRRNSVRAGNSNHIGCVQIVNLELLSLNMKNHYGYFASSYRKVLHILIN